MKTGPLKILTISVKRPNVRGRLAADPRISICKYDNGVSFYFRKGRKSKLVDKSLVVFVCWGFPVFMTSVVPVRVVRIIIMYIDNNLLIALL